MILQQLAERARRGVHTTVSVAGANDREVLEAVYKAIGLKISRFILFGAKKEIIEILESCREGLSENPAIQIREAGTPEIAAQEAVKAVSNKEADILMKGNVATSAILKQVLNKEYGLRTDLVLSHVALFELPEFGRPLLLTDAAMNIAPDAGQKAQIIRNAAAVARKLGISRPLVACLAAVETVNPSMPATLDAKELTRMNKSGEIEGCIVEGPLAFDASISEEAALQKGIRGEVAGKADILLVPSIEVGNALYKSFVYFGKAKVASIIAGAKAPIVLTSRSDSAEAKLHSLALAVCAAGDIPQ